MGELVSGFWRLGVLEVEVLGFGGFWELGMLVSGLWWFGLDVFFGKVSASDGLWLCLVVVVVFGGSGCAFLILVCSGLWWFVVASRWFVVVGGGF